MYHGPIRSYTTRSCRVALASLYMFVQSAAQILAEPFWNGGGTAVQSGSSKRDKASAECEVAIKKLTNFASDDYDCLRVLREIQIMKKLNQ